VYRQDRRKCHFRLSGNKIRVDDRVCSNPYNWNCILRGSLNKPYRSHRKDGAPAFRLRSLALPAKTDIQDMMCCRHYAPRLLSFLSKRHTSLVMQNPYSQNFPEKGLLHLFCLHCCPLIAESVRRLFVSWKKSTTKLKSLVLSYRAFLHGLLHFLLFPLVAKLQPGDVLPGLNILGGVARPSSRMGAR